MKLTYWAAECLDDHGCYNARAKTKKACQQHVDESPSSFGPVHKVEIEYSDGFDLLTMCMGEGSIYEGE